MHWPLRNVIHRPSYLAMVDYYGTLKKKTQMMSYLFWLATPDLYPHNKALDILLHRANTILVRRYFLLLVNCLTTNHMII